jgi:hypothetical protein
MGAARKTLNDMYKQNVVLYNRKIICINYHWISQLRHWQLIVYLYNILLLL